MTFSDNKWFTRTLIPNPKYRLVCFPHAGGSSSFFNNWSKALGPDCEVLSICYPGRASRIEEELPRCIVELGKDIAEELKSTNVLPLFFFGHSLGSLVALETARCLEDSNFTIKKLICSGSRNGAMPKSRSYIEESDEELFKHLLDMGGTDPDAFKDDIFIDLVLPAIKADGKMFRHYHMSKAPKLSCPIVTLYGDSDSHADIRPWEELTTNNFTERVVSGGHFYLINNPPFKIIQDLIGKEST